jgi:hypothetical protein
LDGTIDGWFDVDDNDVDVVVCIVGLLFRTGPCNDEMKWSITEVRKLVNRDRSSGVYC